MSVKPIRSRSYPSIPLRDAVAAVAKIEGPYRASPADRKDAAKLHGYSGLSGPANMALAALASYGLVERAGKGQMRVTSRARAILHAASKAERRENLVAAALEPQLFRDIQDRFEGIAIPPEDGVLTYLNREGFNPNVVGRAAKAFLETARFIEEEGASDSNGGDLYKDVDSGGDGDDNPDDPPPPERKRKREARPGMKEDVYTLPEGDVVLQWPDRLSQDSFDDITAWTELVLRKLKRHVVSEDKTPKVDPKSMFD